MVDFVDHLETLKGEYETFVTDDGLIGVRNKVTPPQGIDSPTLQMTLGKFTTEQIQDIKEWMKVEQFDDLAAILAYDCIFGIREAIIESRAQGAWTY